VERGRILVQPVNKGTAPAIAYGALRILDEDPEGVVAFIPADHYYDDDARFVEALRHGFEAAARNPASLILLGAEPDRAETEYGWIEPANVAGDSKPVICFWEKPSLPHAADLLRRGCLWNTFVMVGRARTFRDLLYSAVPGMILAFETALAGRRALEPDAARRLYQDFPTVDFSHQVLSVSTAHLLVLQIAGTRWSDLGKPERVMETLDRAGIRPQWETAPLHSNKAIA
jgi:mannose-1-phosphate guanylyltransferase